MRLQGRLDISLSYANVTERNSLAAYGAILALSLLSGRALGEGPDHPTTGLVYNTKEASSLAYSCVPVGSDSLECDFNQARVMRKAEPRDLDDQLAQARKEFKSGEAAADKDCDSSQNAIDIIEGRKPAKDPARLQNLSSLEKADLVGLMKAFAQFCRTKSEDDYLKIVRHNHDREVRTCSVAALSFHQSFSRVPGLNSPPAPWIAKGNPEGTCGVVQLSRFVPEKPEGFTTLFWKYVARKAITNPDGEIVPGTKCAGFDEREYLYDWRSTSQALNCDYIEFSPL